jgi:2-polyprenyl-3-methyl-5-hydroxy-6-metoxy-1,4-benzoquinol methylase
MKRPFIDFYEKIGFAPTGQQEGQVQKHRENRTNLYRKLGLHSGVFRGANVLEVGPGSGENSIDLLDRGIRSLKLVDGVPAVLESLKARIETETPVTYELFDASRPPTNPEVFDIVLCEGVIPLQHDPVLFFQNISRSVAPGGILIVTTMDGISTLSEILRRISAVLLFQHDGLNTESLSSFFQEDFQALPDMSRKPSNWVLDSIQNPWIGKLFSIEDALTESLEGFRPISMTPNLHSDMEWYKTINSNKSEISKWIHSYQENCHRLIDFRVSNGGPIDASLNRRLAELSSRIFVEMQRLNSGEFNDAEKLLFKLLNCIIDECNQLELKTRKSLIAYSEFLKSGEPRALKEFRPFWGRGQQYVCFERGLDLPK